MPIGLPLKTKELGEGIAKIAVYADARPCHCWHTSQVRRTLTIWKRQGTTSVLPRESKGSSGASQAAENSIEHALVYSGTASQLAEELKLCATWNSDRRHWRL